MVAARNTVYDFARRTLKNLEAIEICSVTDPEKCFEVTQLINSAIGLLIFPKEADYNSIPQTSLSTVACEVALPKVLHGSLPEDNLRKLITYMRNGFAHYNVEFENYNNVIKGIYIWNDNGRGVDWVAYISIEDLKNLLLYFAKRLTKATEKLADSTPLDDLEQKIGKNLRIVSQEARH